MRKMEYHSIIIVTQIIAAFKKHFVTLYQSLACYQKLYNSQKEDERGPMLHSWLIYEMNSMVCDIYLCRYDDRIIIETVSFALRSLHIKKF